MSNSSRDYLIQRTLYDLKQKYGEEIQIYRLESASTNYETGVKSATKSVIDIRKAIVLPTIEMRRFFASIAFINASKQFLALGNQGFDQSSRGFIIEARDIEPQSSGFEFELEDWIVYRSHRYDVAEIERLEFDVGWLILGKEVKGSIPERVINLNASSVLEIEDESEST